ncbi:MAG: tetratricopeptide repeat protein [Bryobacteraceae bacterium]
MLRFVPLLFAGALFGSTADFERARQLYNRTDYEGSLAILLALPHKDAVAWGLIGRNHYMAGDFKKASEAYEKAVAAEPSSSAYAHGLGRAFGRRAETSSPFTAPGYATNARKSFERAVELDPKNLEAMNDLFEYYLQAPGFLGGGFDKATALAARIAALDAIEGHYLQARLAEKRKDAKTAEAQLRRAVELAPMQVGRVIDLAKFLSKQGRHQESDQAFLAAEKIDPKSPKLLFNRAETYVRAGRNLDAARAMLRRYLASPLTPGDPSRAEAEKLLKEAGG